MSMTPLCYADFKYLSSQDPLAHSSIFLQAECPANLAPSDARQVAIVKGTESGSGSIYIFASEIQGAGQKISTRRPSPMIGSSYTYLAVIGRPCKNVQVVDCIRY
jgi:hypothetical protein